LAILQKSERLFFDIKDQSVMKQTLNTVHRLLKEICFSVFKKLLDFQGARQHAIPQRMTHRLLVITQLLKSNDSLTAGRQCAR